MCRAITGPVRLLAQLCPTACSLSLSSSLSLLSMVLLLANRSPTTTRCSSSPVLDGLLPLVLTLSSFPIGTTAHLSTVLPVSSQHHHHQSRRSSVPLTTGGSDIISNGQLPNNATAAVNIWCPTECTCVEENFGLSSKKWQTTSQTTQQTSLPSSELTTAASPPASIWNLIASNGHADKIKWKTSGTDPAGVSPQQQSHNHRKVIRIDCTGVGLNVFRWKDLQNGHNQTSSSMATSASQPPARPLVTTLVLSGNQIGHIQGDHFEGSNHAEHQQSGLSHLRRLYLNNNRLTRLDNETFALLRSLEYLNLASNQIVTLEVLCFVGLNKLKTLDLSSNRIKVFPSDQIQPSILSQLAEVNLRNNQIHWIPEEAFTVRHYPSNQSSVGDGGGTNSSLIKFDLASNPLVQVHQNAFINLPRLRKLYLSEIENQEHFPSLQNCDSFEHLKMDRSRLHYIDSNLCRQVGHSLKSLVLKSNLISYLPSSFHLCTELRVLDLSYNELRTLPANALIGQSKLIDLALGHNQIELIERNAFVGLASLKVLNLESNQIVHIDSQAFVPLTSLLDINLGHNHFAVLPTEGLININEIKVHGNRNLREFPSVESFPYVHHLALSYAYHCCPYIGRMQVSNSNANGRDNSPHLHDSILWLEDTDTSNVNLTINELAQQFWKQYSHPLDYSDYEAEQLNVQYGYFSNDLFAAIEKPSTYPWENLFDQSNVGEHKIPEVYLQPGHGPLVAKPIRCLPTPGPFMPCKDLFDWWTLRFGVWIIFPLALIGNGMVLVVLVFGRRRRRRRKLDVPRFLVCNLAAADFFMGIYLGMLALVDASTLNHFRSYAIRWQNSWACQMTGFTGVFSAELSVYTLAVITLERNYAITHAMHLNKRLSLRAASTIMSVGWVFSLVMAILPLIGISDYRKFAVCLPFETDDSIWSKLYVLSLIAFNGLAFALLMGCYLRMYCAIRGSQAWNSNDTRIAMRMGLLVFTDFLCWAPIAFFTVTAISGWNLISLEEAKIFTVFVLPLNACANPFLYAFFTKQFKKECATLYKRIDAVTSPITHYCLAGRNNQQMEEADYFPVTGGECKVCGHRSRNHSRAIGASRASHHQSIHSVSSNPIEPVRPVCHSVPKAVMVTSNPSIANYSNSESKIVDNDNQQPSVEHIESNQHETTANKEIAQAEDSCKCRCHCEDIAHSRSVQLNRSVEGDSDKTWSAGQMIRNLFSINSERNAVPVAGTVRPNNANNSINSSSSTLFNKRRSTHGPSGKQFKSNSIIYQSNYRKNHVHMTLENEFIRTPSPAAINPIHPKLTRYASDSLETRKQHNKQATTSRKHALTSRKTSTPPCVHSQVDQQEGIKIHEMPSSKSSSMSSGNNRTSRQEGSSNKSGEKNNNSAMASREDVKVNNQTNNSEEELGKPKALTDCSEESSDLANSAANKNTGTSSNAMTSGIMMLKNKLTRKSYNNRKLSSDSQYEFSYYGRKDSTSTTGRLSFSSDAATKSTSSSFVSSGIWNSRSSGSAGTGANAGKELILNHFHYQKLIELSEMVSNVDSWFPHRGHHYQHEKQWQHYRYLTLSLCKHKLREFLRERHNTHNSRKLNLADRIDENGESQEMVVIDHQLTMLYLLSKSQPNQWLIAETRFASTSQEEIDPTEEQFDQLEVFLMAKNVHNADHDEQEEDDYINLVDIDLNLCADCTQHYLINRLMDHITNSCEQENEEHESVEYMDQHYAHTLLLNCSVRQLRETDRSRSDELCRGAKSPDVEMSNKKYLKSQAANNNNNSNNNKLLSNSHEKILNFLQILLPKSAKLGGNGTGSAGSGRKVANDQRNDNKSGKKKGSKTVTTTRRSSSAYVLGEEVKSHNDSYCSVLDQRELCIKSCSQLQVIGGGGQSSSHNSKSSSCQDTRCRSVISDVIIPGSSSGIISETTPSHVIVIRSPSSNDESLNTATDDQNYSVSLYSETSRNSQAEEEKYRSYEFIA